MPYVLAIERDLVGVFTGHHIEAHLAGCKMVEQMSVQQLSEPVDLVVTSAGGYPLDAIFYKDLEG